MTQKIKRATSKWTVIFEPFLRQQIKSAV